MSVAGLLKTTAVVVLAAGAGVGGTLGALAFMPHGASMSGPAKPAPPAPPKPTLFAEIADITVSIPPDSGEPATSYLQFAVQFATTDPNALVVFAQLQPIIKADIINLLMNETSHGLQDPAARVDLMKNCLDICNEILAQKAAYPQPKPFDAAYITNFVVQD